MIANMFKLFDGDFCTVDVTRERLKNMIKTMIQIEKSIEKVGLREIFEYFIEELIRKTAIESRDRSLR